MKLAGLAARQHGIIAHYQLRALGYGKGAIDSRLRARRLHPIHRGVYAVGHRALPPRGRTMAAVLACGPGAVASHRAAADEWDLRSSAAASIDVTVPGGTRRRKRAGIIMHQVRRLPVEDHTVRNGIPITTVPRTLLDLAAVLRAEQLARTFEQAERLRLLDVNALEELCRNRPRHRGVRPLARLLAQEHSLDALDTRSELERQFVELCRAARLPPPAVNAVVEGLEVDASWLDRRVIVELDSRAFHSTRAAFERDRAKDMKLQLAGYTVLRLTHRRLETDWAGVAAGLRSRLLGRA